MFNIFKLTNVIDVFKIEKKKESQGVCQKTVHYVVQVIQAMNKTEV